jgi:tyrosine-protein kinase Etk/Wzc
MRDVVEAGTELPVATKGEINLLDVVIMLLREKRFIVYFVAICTLVAVVTVLILPNKYTSKTTLLPPSQGQSASSLLMGQMGGLLAGLAGGGGKDLLKNPADTYIGLLKSQTVSDKLINRFDLMKVYGKRHIEDARKKLASNSDIGTSKQGLIEISVSDRDRKRAADLANGYVDVLREMNQQLAITEAAQRRLFFEKQLFAAKENLANAEVALRQTMEKTGILQIESETKSIIESVASLRAQIAAKEVQIQSMQVYATEDNPAIRVLEQQRMALQDQLAKLTNGKGNVDDLDIPSKHIPEAGLEYVRRFRDTKYYEAMYELIAKQYEAARLDEAREGAIVQVVDTATVPGLKSSPERTLIIVVVFFSSLLIACGIAVIRTSLERAAHDPEHLERLRLIRSYARWTPRV